MSFDAGKIQQWGHQLKQVTSQYDTEFGKLNKDQLNWKPNPGTWSIAQNIAHIIATNESYFVIPEKISSGNYRPPLLGRFNFITSFIGKAMLKGVGPERSKKIKTFAIWEPSMENLAGNIVESFKEMQTRLLDFIESSRHLLEKNTIISSPANKNIVYSLENAFEIIISHEKRHFNQAKEVLTLMPESF